jgi:hypothetical protein
MNLVANFVSRKFLRSIGASALLAGALLTAGSSAFAQAAKPTRVRGTITTFSDDVLKVKTKAGQDVTVKLAKETPIRGVTLAQVSDIKKGSYIGSAAVPQADGTLRALEIHVFPPSMAGSGDGHRAWDLGKNSSMTNGKVGDLVVSNGRTITVRYKSGEKKIVIPDNVPIVNLEAGDRSLLVPGAHLVLSATKADDGSLTAEFISVGKNGVVPPM